MHISFLYLYLISVGWLWHVVKKVHTFPMSKIVLSIEHIVY